MASFLDISLTTRQRIYRYALVSERVFVRPLRPMKHDIDNSRTGMKEDRPNLALLRASHVVYAEAMPIFLGENVFSIAQVDGLAAIAHEHPRALNNLSLIRNIELVFDVRDYLQMARQVIPRLLAVSLGVEEKAESGESKTTLRQNLFELQSRFVSQDPKRLRLSLDMPLEHITGESLELHERHIANLQYYFWGRTLTFIRQHFQLSHLYVDISNCTCVGGCCRLATQVFDWGWFFVWLKGAPKEIHVVGAKGDEKGVISQILEQQNMTRDMTVEEIYDASKVVGHQRVLDQIDILRRVKERMTR